MSRLGSGSLFDNPKTNLTYEKNLYNLYSKYHAKHLYKDKLFHGKKKMFLSV